MPKNSLYCIYHMLSYESLTNAYFEVQRHATLPTDKFPVIIVSKQYVIYLAKALGYSQDEAEMYWDLIMLSGEEQELF